MARRRRRSSSRKRSYRRSSSNFGKVALIGVAGYLAYKTFLAPKLPIVGASIPLLELGAGYFLSKKRGLVGDTGKVMLVMGLLSTGSQYLGGSLNAPMTNGGITAYY